MIHASVPVCSGEPPLTARTEVWMEELLADPSACHQLLREHGSPINVHDFSALERNASELTTAATRHGVRLKVFIARKANKTLGLVDAATRAGHGLDVASFHELQQCLQRGVDADNLIVTAAVKTLELLELATKARVVISIDNEDELSDLRCIAAALPTGAPPPRVALRLCPSDPNIPASRFGLTERAWLQALSTVPSAPATSDDSALNIEGVHFHLNGYSADERAQMLLHACHLVDELRTLGHPVKFIDMGGGIPMSYLEDETQWRAFWSALDQDTDPPATWKGDRLGMIDPHAERPSATVYPFWQAAVRGPWLDSILQFTTPPTTSYPARTVAQMLIERGLELRCEPGRAMLDGCGMTLASVAFTKQDRDGQALIGLHMNRTQMRSTSTDVLIDPRWIRSSEAPAGKAQHGYLVGAYCIEEEILLRRRLHFPHGVARDDIVAFVNTAGYLMHILESASHQLPLARNLERRGSLWKVDDIDAAVTHLG